MVLQVLLVMLPFRSTVTVTLQKLGGDILGLAHTNTLRSAPGASATGDGQANAHSRGRVAEERAEREDLAQHGERNNLKNT